LGGGNRVLESRAIPDAELLDSTDNCFLCLVDGKLVMLLWMTGDTRRRFMSGVPSLLGRTGLWPATGFPGDAFSK
jgi:hypothetical protein